jgi:peptide-methionine (S)-S-oxide reductase
MASHLRFFLTLSLGSALLLGASLPVPSPAAPGAQTTVLAGGCFWGMDAVFQHVKGVSKVVAGYAGGTAATADYETVSSGRTGHAESVQITFDPARITYGQLLRVFFSVADDPTEWNREGRMKARNSAR